MACYERTQITDENFVQSPHRFKDIVYPRYHSDSHKTDRIELFQDKSEQCFSATLKQEGTHEGAGGGRESLCFFRLVRSSHVPPTVSGSRSETRQLEYYSEAITLLILCPVQGADPDSVRDLGYDPAATIWGSMKFVQRREKPVGDFTIKSCLLAGGSQTFNGVEMEPDKRTFMACCNGNFVHGPHDWGIQKGGIVKETKDWWAEARTWEIWYPEGTQEPVEVFPGFNTIAFLTTKPSVLDPS